MTAETMKNDGLNIMQALEALKAGYKVTREGWNGKDQWVSMTNGKTLTLGEDTIWTKHIRDEADANGGTVNLSPYLSIKTAQGDIQIGWIASQSDMLADDWRIV